MYAPVTSGCSAGDGIAAVILHSLGISLRMAFRLADARTFQSSSVEPISVSNFSSRESDFGKRKANKMYLTTIQAQGKFLK